MVFENFKENNAYTSVEEQHNIMVFIGNGFDISILKKYGKDNLITSYGS